MSFTHWNTCLIPGPLLPESLDVRGIPFSQARQLTIDLTGKEFRSNLFDILVCEQILSWGRGKSYQPSGRPKQVKLTETLIIIVQELYIVLKKITTTTSSHGTPFDIALGNHALRAQPTKLVINLIADNRLICRLRWFPKSIVHVEC